MIAMLKNRALGCRVYEPTPKDIRRACKQIQSTWSPQERSKRNRGRRAARWTPPINRLSDLIEAVIEERAERLPYVGS